LKDLSGSGLGHGTDDNCQMKFCVLQLFAPSVYSNFSKDFQWFQIGSKHDYCRKIQLILPLKRFIFCFPTNELVWIRISPDEYIHFKTLDFLCCVGMHLKIETFCDEKMTSGCFFPISA